MRDKEAEDKPVDRMKDHLQPVQRLFLGLFVTAFALALVSQLLPSVASAGGQVTGRSITMSSSAPSATSVTYTVNFTAFTSETHPDVIIDFCANDPLPGDTCTATAGTDTPNFSSAAASGWTVTSIDSNHDVKLTTTTNSFTGGVAITPIVITGVTNPSNAASFFARILVYATNGSSTYSSPTVLGSVVDTGGIALSTTSNINITSKVFETLTFCVFQSSCGTPAVLILGDPTTQALSISNAYLNANAQYTLATNAGSGVNVVMRGTTLCRSGGTCTTGANAFTISAIGVTPAALATGTEQFGMCADKNGSAALTVAAQYADTTSGNNCHGLTPGPATYAGTSRFGFDDTSTVTTGTASAGGSQVMSSGGEVPTVTGTFGFLGDIAATTEAGIYTTSLNMVATGTF